MHSPKKYGILILAAGNSSRLGRPKQLLAYKNQTLIRRIAEAAIEVARDTTCTVTGSNADHIAKELADLPCSVINNPNWAEGMGSSIAAGVSQMVLLHPGLSHILITVCDQPFVDAAVFRSLIALSAQTGKGIIACSYAATIGAPVLFSNVYFKMLSGLSGGEGAKKLIKEFADDMAVYTFPAGSIDVDTETDYQNLLNRK